MKILYVAKHTPSDNEDEMAIGYAMEKLGHKVERVQDFAATKEKVQSIKADMCLFHNWADYSAIEAIQQNMPVVCWFFDKISFEDEKLQGRSNWRKQWVTTIHQICDYVFLTDGDWVNQGKVKHGLLNKYRWLMQGADERKIGFGDPVKRPRYEIMFTGTLRHGIDRELHVAHLQRRWGSKFTNLGSGRPETRIHGRELANVFAATKVIIAPEAPVSDFYWSNRVYLTLGFGGYLLHPYSKGLREHYDAEELPMYSSREELDEMIERALDPEYQEERLRASHVGLEVTKRHHLYRHRVEQLLNHVLKTPISTEGIFNERADSKPPLLGATLSERDQPA